MRVVGFGTYDSSRHPRIGVLLEGFRESGDEVVEIVAPLGISTSQRVELLQRPWLIYRLVFRVARCWFSLIRQRMQRRGLATADVVIVGYMGHFDVLLARVLFPRQTVVLDQLLFASDTASDRGESGAIKMVLLRLLDRLAGAVANLVMVDTEENIALLPLRQRPKAVVVPVGASSTWRRARRRFEESRPDEAVKVIFYGLYTPLQGAATIGEAMGLLAHRDDISFTMIGSGQDFDVTQRRALANPHVKWLSWTPANELVKLVSEHDVCLGIFGSTPKARRVIPNKVYQGASVGCAVVTSATEPQRRAFGEALIFVEPDDARGLARALGELADDRRRAPSYALRSADWSDEHYAPLTLAEILRQRLD